MLICYKIEGQNVARSVFQSSLNDTATFDTWEKVIEEYKQEIENRKAAVIFKFGENEFRVLTETYLLVKLSSAVNKYMKLVQMSSETSAVAKAKI